MGVKLSSIGGRLSRARARQLTFRHSSESAWYNAWKSEKRRAADIRQSSTKWSMQKSRMKTTTHI